MFGICLLLVLGLLVLAGFGGFVFGLLVWGGCFSYALLGLSFCLYLVGFTC